MKQCIMCFVDISCNFVSFRLNTYVFLFFIQNIGNIMKPGSLYKTLVSSANRIEQISYDDVEKSFM